MQRMFALMSSDFDGGFSLFTNKSDGSDESSVVSVRTFTMKRLTSESMNMQIAKNNEGSLRGKSKRRKESGVSDDISKSSNSANGASVKNEEIEEAEELHDLSNIAIPDYEPSRVSNRKHAYIKSYAANTSQGISRNYNEDRVAIIMNMKKPEKKVIKDWPKCSFFGIFDGHGGTTCADYLRDNLYLFVINNDNFPSDPK